MLAFAASRTSAGARFLIPAALLAFAAIGYTETITVSNVWTVPVSGYSDSSAAVAPDGTVYFGTWGGDLQAVNPEGTSKWVFHSGREIRSSPAIGNDGTVYFGSRNRQFFAVGADGREHWRFKTGAWVDSSPAIGADGTVYFGSWDKKFYALDRNGVQKWAFATGGPIVSSPAVDAAGRIYFGSHDQKFYALSADGAKLWEYSTGAPVVSSPAIDKDGTLYFTSIDGWFYAMKHGGDLKWRLKTGSITESSPVIGPDGTVYVGVNSELLAIQPDGTNKWAQPYEQLIDAAPLSLADNSVCFISHYGLLINLEAPNQFRWTYYLYGHGYASPSCGAQGLIYIPGPYSYKALKVAVPVALAQSPWPKFRGNPQNTGRVETGSP